MSMAKQEVNKEVVLRQLYTELNKFGNNGEWEKAKKTANKILGMAVTEEKAIHCKIVCLIQLSKFEEALEFIEKNNLHHLVFEKAYCQYRNNNPEQALKTIEAVNEQSLSHSLRELKAQVYYRLEQYNKSFELYKEIIKTTSEDEYEDERKTNLSAVVAHLVSEGTDRQLPNFEDSNYELVYNKACALLGEKNFFEAEKKLKLSEKLCREYLEEDGMSEEDINNEVAIIRIQLAYCLQNLGKSKDAAAIYLEVLKKKPSDSTVVAVASNNSVVINKDQNVFDSKKKMRTALSEDHKLNSKQKKLIGLNNVLLAYYAHQPECTGLANKLAYVHKDLDFKCALIAASYFAKEKKFKDAVSCLEKFTKNESEFSLASKFAIVHLHLVAGNKQAAIDLLQSLGEHKYYPGVVSALVTLLVGIDNKQKAAQVLKDAVEWYKKNKNQTTNLSDMWRQAATFHLRGGEVETAAKSLEELLKTNPNDVKILAQLVIAYSQFDTSKAKEISKRLPKLESLANAAEIDALEATNWTMIAKAVKKTVRNEQSPGTGGSEIAKDKRKAKKKKKPKLPKNYDLSVKPDPERWLPKYERTGYKKKRDRRVKEIIKGSQGTASGQSDQFDMTKSYNQSKPSPVTPQVLDQTAGPRQQQRKHQYKKKKGKH